MLKLAIVTIICVSITQPSYALILDAWNIKGATITAANLDCEPKANGKARIVITSYPYNVTPEMCLDLINKIRSCGSVQVDFGVVIYSDGSNLISYMPENVRDSKGEKCDPFPAM